MTVRLLLQRIARTPQAQAILRRPGPARVGSALIGASIVRGSVRFLWRELVPGGALAQYRLRRSPRTVFIRHKTADSLVLIEIFDAGHYDVPARIASSLENLDRPPVVLDLGANIGLFGVWALDRFPGAEVTSFEPDPANVALARRCIEASGETGRWRLVEAAATARDGQVLFLSGEFSRSRIEPERGGVPVEAVDVFPYLAGVDFAKVDIEGGEWEILADPRFRELRVPALVLEYHVDQAPGPHPRDLAVEAVQRAGYEIELVHEFGPGQGIVWAWRPA